MAKKELFANIKTLQDVMAVALDNRDKFDDPKFYAELEKAWDENRTNQIGKYGRYQAEAKVSLEYYVTVIRTLGKLEKLPVYTEGKKSGRVHLTIRFDKSRHGVNISGDTRLVKDTLKGLGFCWNHATCEWWCNFKAERPLPELPKSAKGISKVTVKKQAEEAKVQEPKKVEQPKKTEPKSRKLEGAELKKAMADFKEKALARRQALERRKKALGNW